MRDAMTDHRAIMPVRVLGLPIAPLTTDEVLDEVDALVDRGEAAFFITANLHYAMLSASDRRLQTLNDRAAFIVADGHPVVWWSRLVGGRVPERVAGADLIDLIAGRLARRGRRLYLYGAEPGVADIVGEKLAARHPGLVIAGTDAPPFRRLTDDEERASLARIREGRPDVVFVALGQPKGELWIDEHMGQLGGSVFVQLGASFDFIAGRARRAPRWMQRAGLEWLHRAVQEPRRLVGRYSRNLLFLARAVVSGRLLVERRVNRVARSVGAQDGP
jgi:N-acetylglucosaminyldiphosphoundecaprenol N-acetyl-beta-D-mannosaminyltransferase